MRHRLLLCMLLVLSVFTAWGQSKRAFERAGDEAFKKKEYNAAFQYYTQVVNKAPGNLDAQWKYAESAMLFYAYDLAEKAYRMVQEDQKARKKYPLCLFRLGEIAQIKGRYTEATDWFEQYLSVQPETQPWSDKARLGVAACNWAEKAIQEAPLADIKHLDKKINSPYSDFAPVAMGDTLFFSSYRFEKFNRKTKEKSRITRLMTSVGGKPAREPLRGIPSGDSAHIAHTAFTPDGLFMIFNYCRNTGPMEIRCELWIINKDIKGRWTKPRKLPEPLNLPGYTSTQPFIAAEQGGKKLRLWFVSDRPGGKGKTDIWSAPLDTDWFCPCNLPLDARRPQKLPDFEAPQPAEAINTPESEYSPYFHSPTSELYFSTDGRPGFGLQDVYRVKVEKNGWSEPENLGYGINSSYNDVYFSLSKDGKTGYISSNRPGAYYLDERNKACCNDIFALQMYPPKPETPPLSDTSALTIKTPPPLPLPPSNPTPPPPVLADFKGLPLFFDNDEPDKRTRKTSTKKTYETTVLDYLERQQEYRERRMAGLKETAAEAAENEVNAFFDNEVRSGYERLNQLCELLLQRLQAGDTLEILIKGFTSPRAQSDYNLNLGKRRISSVRNHLAEWSEGALRGYIAADLLRITETSFGETTAKAGLSDDLRDERNSVYAPDAARERRVEIVEIKTNRTK